MKHLRPSLALALCTAVAGCVATPGNFCHRDEDCVAPLRCTGTREVRGVCVYPEAIPDALVLRDAFAFEMRPPRDGQADAGAPDAADAGDAAPDAADAGPADSAPDAAPPEDDAAADGAPDLPGPGPEPDLGAADTGAAEG